MEYFNLKGLVDYQIVAKTTYKSNTKESKWFYDTRDKLKYLVNLLSKKLDTQYQFVYTEKPNGQAGQEIINYKNYVLAGFSTTNKYGDDLFMKIAISNIKENPVFDINIDMNFKKRSSYFSNRRDEIFKKHYQEWKIDDNFPNNWDALINLIKAPPLSIEFRRALRIRK